MQSQNMLAVQQQTSSLNTGAAQCIPQRMHCMHRCQRLPLLRCSAAVVTQPPAWHDIQQQSGSDVLRDYVIRRGQAPGTAPHAVVPTQRMTAPHSKPVLLWRDTNAWCPFCERVRTHAHKSKSGALHDGWPCSPSNTAQSKGSGVDTLQSVCAGVDGTYREACGI